MQVVFLAGRLSRSKVTKADWSSQDLKMGSKKPGITYSTCICLKLVISLWKSQSPVSEVPVSIFMRFLLSSFIFYGDLSGLYCDLNCQKVTVTSTNAHYCRSVTRKLSTELNLMKETVQLTELAMHIASLLLAKCAK